MEDITVLDDEKDRSSKKTVNSIIFSYDSSYRFNLIANILRIA